MKRAVVGFAFDQYGRVLLVRKAKPVFMAGKWNGVGGKADATPDETYPDAMVREFKEETGISTALGQWGWYATLTFLDQQFELGCFATMLERIKTPPVNDIGEQLGLHTVECLPRPLCDHMLWLVPAAKQSFVKPTFIQVEIRDHV